MHQYKIIATAYSEEGALTSNKTVVYKDTPEQAQQSYEAFKNAKQENGFKAYSVKLLIAAYKTIEDAEAFFAQFTI